VQLRGVVIDIRAGRGDDAIKPRSDALDWLAGNADLVAAHAQTWRNVANGVSDVHADFVRGVATGTAGWQGAAGDAYRSVAAGPPTWSPPHRRRRRAWGRRSRWRAWSSPSSGSSSET
jgi:hypothetical protein